MTSESQRIGSNLFKFIESRLEDIAARRINKIQKLLDEAQMRVFKVMASMGVDVPAPPRLGKFSPSWEPLSSRYMATKGNTRFYKRTGALKGALNRIANPAGVLGKPRIRFKPASLTTGGVSASFETWRGSKSKRRIIRDATGRFVSPKNVSPRISARFIVDFYPMIKNLDKLSEYQLFSKKTAYKLRNVRGERLRPLVIPFLKWYAEVEFNKAVSKGLG